MNPAALAAFLHEKIPLSAAMDVSVVSASASEVVLEAPLDPNINVHGTMFGGSVSTLACWRHGRCCTCGWRPKALPINW